MITLSRVTLYIDVGCFAKSSLWGLCLWYIFWSYQY